MRQTSDEQTGNNKAFAKAFQLTTVGWSYETMTSIERTRKVGRMQFKPIVSWRWSIISQHALAQ
jgi:hypothetical protein